MLKHRKTISLPVLFAIQLISFCCECFPIAPVVKTAAIIDTKSNKENRISETDTVCIAEKSCGTTDGNMKIQ